MNCRKRPCAECPWVKDTPPGQFPPERYEELRNTSPRGDEDTPLGSPLFACHKSTECNPMPCAGWLASVGYDNLSARVAMALGRIPVELLEPGADWPELHASYAELLAVHGDAALYSADPNERNRE